MTNTEQMEHELDIDEIERALPSADLYTMKALLVAILDESYQRAVRQHEDVVNTRKNFHEISDRITEGLGLPNIRCENLNENLNEDLNEGYVVNMWPLPGASV